MRAVALAAGKPFAQGIHRMPAVVSAGQVIGKRDVAQVAQRAGQANMHVHARQQNLRNRSLAHEIRCSGMEPLRNAVGIFAAREEYDGQIVERMPLPNAQANFVAVEARHVDI